MFCIKCGKKNPPEFTFCYNCGTTLVKPQTGDTQQAADNHNQASQQTPPPHQPPPPRYQLGYRPMMPPPSFRREVKRVPVASNGKPFVVVDHPEAFVAYKNKDNKQVYAAIVPTQSRVLASFVDTFLCYVPLTQILPAIVGYKDPAINSSGSKDGYVDPSQVPHTVYWIYLLIITLYLIYCVLMTWLNRGQTIGKMVLGIKVIGKDGQRPGFQTALKRNLFGYCFGLGVCFPHDNELSASLSLLLMLVVAGGFSLAFFQKQHRGAHDLLADTLVVSQQELVEGINY